MDWRWFQLGLISQMTQVRVLLPQQKYSSGERIRRPWSTVDATYGYNNVSKKSSEQDEVIIMAARAGSTPALSTKKVL